MKASLVVFGLVRLAKAALGQEPHVAEGRLNVPELPPPPLPVEEVVICNGQVYGSSQEADAADEELLDRQRWAKQATGQPDHPVAERHRREAGQSRMPWTLDLKFLAKSA